MTLPPPTRYLFTSESVSEGHPDKLCDQISDAILDACLTLDPDAKCAVETATKGNFICILGEITLKANAKINYEQIVRNVIQEIGYDGKEGGNLVRLAFDYKTCEIRVQVDQQSPDIAQGLEHGSSEAIGAGDQGIMFGYATNETPELMPFSLLIAHRLNMELSRLRKDGTYSWLRPDSKAQVTVQYQEINGITVPLRIHTIVISAQHSDKVTNVKIREALHAIISSVIPDQYIDDHTIYHLNPSGRFIIGGPMGDAGLTGRKIIVDTYGGWGAHGGGAFSGKDFSKVDRSAAYAARWIAKSLVASSLCHRCLVQVSYAIGIAKPLSIFVDSYGTSRLSNEDLVSIINRNWDLRPGIIVKELDLRKPIYQSTAAYGHFGRGEFTWEKPRALILKAMEMNSAILV